MQYKIPVQIENEDKIFLNLSVRQLTIMMVGGGLGYSLFGSLKQSVGDTVALFPSVGIILVFVVVALFKNSEMTFLPFILNLIRLNLNAGQRLWSKGVDSFSKIEVGYINMQISVGTKVENKQDHKIYQEIEDKLNKI
ncbi:MAG: PrgI family protein [Candidatus Gracilibacteria bacterium]|nr:PrgI family protein [Candidatus Gracilibacteria bacterium]